jgi:uncharacterized protein YbbC (DUF1343 family)
VNIKIILMVVVLMMTISCKNAQQRQQNVQQIVEQQVLMTGAEQLEEYLPLLRGKKVGMMGNQTSIVGDKHLVDVLLENGIDLKFAFAPEHGFRGIIERGESVANDRDAATGLPLYTLYGRNDKADSSVASVDIMLFDLQDVGARFYTYITSLDRVMQLCARNNVPLIVLDRPNPNGDQVDGPVRKSDNYKSNVSHHKIAMIHGLTIGELALMINGEGWLDNGATCQLHVVTVKGYCHKTQYDLPVIPSPSLPNHLSVRLYLSLCLFEGTEINVGRGTDYPFQILGYPNSVFGDFTFTPGVRDGMALHVENQGRVCYGLDLRDIDPLDAKFTMKYVLDFYHKSKLAGIEFFSRSRFFNLLAGNSELQAQIRAGWTEEQIRQSWASDLEEYKKMRKKYLLYEDFE